VARFVGNSGDGDVVGPKLRIAVGQGRRVDEVDVPGVGLHPGHLFTDSVGVRVVALASEPDVGALREDAQFAEVVEGLRADFRVEVLGEGVVADTCRAAGAPAGDSLALVEDDLGTGVSEVAGSGEVRPRRRRRRRHASLDHRHQESTGSSPRAG